MKIKETEKKLVTRLNSHKVILGSELVSGECFTQVTPTKFKTNVFSRTQGER